MGRASDVTVRDATEADLDRVAELWAEMIDLHYDLDQRFWRRKPDGSEVFRKWMAESLDDEKRVLIVADVAGRVAGFVHGELTDAPPALEDKSLAYISDVAVAFEFRGKGVGRKLMAAAEQRLAELGAKGVTLAAAVKNDSAVGFYEAVGFEHHLLTMWKSLG